MLNNGGPYGSNSGEVVDQINDLKIENADLRKRLLALSSSSGPILASQTTTNSCRLCGILESKVDRLSCDIESLRSLRQESESCEVKDLSDTLARERKRRVRMEAIIDRQRNHIRSLYTKLDSVYEQAEDVSDDGVYVKPAGFDSERYLRLPLEPETSAIPPWDIDMDDLARQLEDLDSNVQRVEASTSRLSNTTRAAFHAHGTSFSGPRSPSHRSPDISKRSVLDKMLKGSLA